MTIEAQAEIRRKQAAEWFTKLNQKKVTTADVRAFSDWRRDPENAVAFSRIEALWDAAGTLSKTPAMARFAEDALDRAKARSRPGLRPSGRLAPIGIIGAVLLAAGIGIFSWWAQERPAAYQTAVGEQRTLELEDGSRVILDTDSRVSVRYTGTRRLVTLTSGRALFDVETDATRPFLVQAGDAEVVAVGTRFDVRRSGAGARVVLVEGRVEVRRPSTTDGTWSLSPGQTVTTSAPRPRVTPTNAPAETSWTVGRLTFENTPIAAAVAEVNRYTATPIELRDGRLSSVRVSGVFNAGDIDGFVAALRDLYALEATTAADGHLVLSAPG